MSTRKTPKRNHRDPLLAVGYVRVSTEEQAQKDLSIPMQERTIRAYAAQRGIAIARVFVEAGVSGRSDENRPALKELIGFVLDPSSKVSQVMVFQTSRFMRNVESARVLKSKLRKVGVRVLSTTQETTDDPNGRLMEGVLEVFDEYESEVNGLRTSSCMRQVARSGYWPGSHPPYGFRIRPVRLESGVTRRLLEHDPVESERAREMFRIAALGNGATNTAREMNRRGLAYRNNKPMTRDLILRLTADTALIGKAVWGRTEPEPVEIDVPPIIDRDLWDLMQRGRKMRSKEVAPGRTTSSPLLLAGLVKCTRCGASYQLEASGKPGPSGCYVYRYYQCRTAGRAGVEVCRGGRISEKLLDDAVLDHLASELFNTAHCRELLRELSARDGALRAKAEQRRSHLRDELDDIEKRVRRWELALEDGSLAPSDAARRLRELETRRHEIDSALAQASSSTTSNTGMPTDAAIETFRAQIREVFLGPDRKLAKGYLRLLVERIDTDGTQVVISGRAAGLPALVAQAEKPSGLTDSFSLACDPSGLRR